MTDAIKVLIADDHPIVRSGLTAALRSRSGIDIVGEARDGLETEEKALQLKPDVVIMDIYMPRRGGLESMVAIKEKLPDVRVLLLTVSEYAEDISRAMRLGADGYILKDTGVEEIIAAVKSVVAGEVVISPRAASLLVRGLRQGDAPARLTKREQDVLTLVGQGLKNSEIGERLFLSPNTANTYLQRVLHKLHLKNRAAAAAYAARHLRSDQS